MSLALQGCAVGPDYVAPGFSLAAFHNRPGLPKKTLRQRPASIAGGWVSGTVSSPPSWNAPSLRISISPPLWHAYARRAPRRLEPARSFCRPPVSTPRLSSSTSPFKAHLARSLGIFPATRAISKSTMWGPPRAGKSISSAVCSAAAARAEADAAEADRYGTRINVAGRSRRRLSAGTRVSSADRSRPGPDRGQRPPAGFG
jgi:hypothetical protein